MTEPAPAPSRHLPVPAAARRLPALDAVRGLVMVLMTIDHASESFNGGRLRSDSARMWKAGSALPATQFLTRWVTHLCAPTFVFLAGAALAMSVERRAAAPGARPDRHIVARGLLLLAFEILWMPLGMIGPGKVLFQVLYALGGSLLAMTLLRRLPNRALLAFGLVLVFGGEALTGGAFALGIGGTLPVALLFTGGLFADGRLIIAYPLLPWLSIMCLGWLFGRWLGGMDDAARAALPRRLVLAGVGTLALFAVVRGLNGYGNLMLLRDDGSLLQWLHVSKYPPSLSYVALELGLMLLALAGAFALTGGTRGVPRLLAPLVALGQTALFYYLLHIHLLAAGAALLGVRHQLGLAAAYGAAAVTLVALYPLCLVYRRYKAAHPKGWARFI